MWPSSATETPGTLVRPSVPQWPPGKQEGFAETSRSVKTLWISLKTKKMWLTGGNRGLAASFCQDGHSHPSLKRPGATCASSKVNCHEWEPGIDFQGWNFQSLNKQYKINTDRKHSPFLAHFQGVVFTPQDWGGIPRRQQEEVNKDFSMRFLSGVKCQPVCPSGILIMQIVLKVALLRISHRNL